MGTVNKVIIIGHVGKDPEIRATGSGKKVANFSVATSESWTDKQTGDRVQKTEWHRVIFFDRIAEVVEKYVKKGAKLYIEGKLETRKWEDKDKIERYTTEVIGQSLTMLDAKEKDEGRDYGAKQADKPKPDDAPFDDEIPF